MLREGQEQVTGRKRGCSGSYPEAGETPPPSPQPSDASKRLCIYRGLIFSPNFGILRIKKKTKEENKAFVSGQLTLICVSAVVKVDLQASTANNKWINSEDIARRRRMV